MRLLHSSDWHLGRTLCGERRDAAFKAFLDWLLELIDARAIDTLLIAGDIFDSAMPPISAQNQYYEFLAALRTRTACRNVIIVSGNHDSALFLDAPGALLNALNIRVIGRAAENPEDSVVAVTDSKGATEAVVCAVPFCVKAICIRSRMPTHSPTAPSGLLKASQVTTAKVRTLHCAFTRLSKRASPLSSRGIFLPAAARPARANGSSM